MTRKLLATGMIVILASFLGQWGAHSQDLPKLALLWENKLEGEGYVLCKISKDGQRIGVSDDQAVYLFDTSGELLWRFAPAKAGKTIVVDISADGGRVLCRHARSWVPDSEEILWNALLLDGSNGNVVLELAVEDYNIPVALSADGKTFLVSGWMRDVLRSPKPSPQAYAMLVDDKGKTLWRSDTLGLPVKGGGYGFLADTGKYALVGTKDRLAYVDYNGRHWLDIDLMGSYPTVSEDAGWILMADDPKLWERTWGIRDYDRSWPVVAPAGDPEPQSWGCDVYSRQTWRVSEVLAIIEVSAPGLTPGSKTRPYAGLVWAHAEGWAASVEGREEIGLPVYVYGPDSPTRAIAAGPAGLLAIITEPALRASQGNITRLYVGGTSGEKEVVVVPVLPGRTLGSVGVAGDGSCAYTYRRLSDGERTAVGNADKEIALWDRGGHVKSKVLLSPEVSPSDVELSYDGQMLVVAAKGKVRAFDVSRKPRDNLD